MEEVYPLRQLLIQLVRASMAHIGAAATSVSLREQLTSRALINPRDFDTIFAAARLTPGTNLIALFAGLGRHLYGVRGAVAAVTVGLAPAVAVSVFVCVLYLRFSAEAEVSKAIAGASAAAMSVLVWAALKFLWRPMRSRALATLAMIVTVIGLQVVGVPSLVLLLTSAAAGAFLFND